MGKYLDLIQKGTVFLGKPLICRLTVGRDFIDFDVANARYGKYSYACI